MKKINVMPVLSIGILLATGLLGCNKNTAEDASVRKVIVGMNQAYPPYAYVNEDGKPTGYEYELLNEIARILPQYKFEFAPSSQEDALLGLDTGRTQIVTSGLFHNPIREEKYGIAKNPECATVTGFFTTADRTEQLKGWNKENGYTDIYDLNLRLAPIPSATGIYGIILEYNEKNPDKYIQFDTITNSLPQTETFAQVLEGRYDASLTNEVSFYQTYNIDGKITPDGTPDPFYEGKFVFVPTYSIGVWPFFNKADTQLIADYDKAFEQLYKDGTVLRLEEKWFAKDVLSQLREHEKVRF